MARYDDTQPYIALDIDWATSIYSAAADIPGVKMYGWSPEHHAIALQRGRQSAENICIHVSCMTPEIESAARALGFDGGVKNGMAILVQKHGPWPRDIYNSMSEAEQVDADRNWINMGGWLSDDKMARLERYNGQSH